MVSRTLRRVRPARDPADTADASHAGLAARANTVMVDKLGARVNRRPEPRLGTALADAGVGLVVLGALSVGGDNAGGTGGSQVPGILLSLAVVVAGDHTVGTISLVLAGVSLVAAIVLDRRDRRGIATPFVFVGIVELAIGVAIPVDDLQQPGEGLAAVVLGLAVVWMGAVASRRLTTWTGAASVWLGAVLLIDEVVGDSSTSVGLAAMLAGVALVAVAHLVSSAWREPDETVPSPSRFAYSGGSTQPWAPPPPPAGSVRG